MMKIEALVRREDTLRRSACSGDNWHTTWSNDDRQFVALCDGRSWQSLLGSPGKPYLCALYEPMVLVDFAVLEEFHRTKPARNG
jgi:hypothetical protein